MSELIKPKKENQFWDSNYIMHNKKKLSTVLNSKLNTSDIKTNLSGNETNKVPSVSAVNNIVSDILKKAYPIGSIYMSVNSTSPATLFGGTWAQLSNRFLVGVGSSYPAGSTGGGTAKDKIKIAGSHYTLADGTIVAGTGYSGQGLISITKNTSESAQTLIGNGITLDPPYLSVYMWKRTA